jgi:hypothetical protein
LLHFVLPGVDLGTGILIGVVSTGVSIHFFLRLMQWLETYGDDPEEDDAFRRIVMYPLGPPAPRRNRKRKPK